MSKPRQCQMGDEMPAKNILSRRNFVCSGGLLAAAFAASKEVFAQAAERAPADESSGIRLGLASYTFRNFSRAQMIGFLKQLNVLALNAKDVKDHLPMDTQEEAAALADYSAEGIKLHAAGTIYFVKDEDADIRRKFEYCKRAGIGAIVAGDPALETLPRLEKFVKEYDIRFAIHNHGPEDKLWHSPLDVLKAVKGMDPRIKLRSSPRAALPARKFRYEAPAGKFGINSGVAAPMAYFPFNGWKESFFGILQGRDAVESFTESEIVVELWSRQETRKF